MKMYLGCASPAWSERHLFEDQQEGEPQDPLRAQVTIDRIADGLFHSEAAEGPALTSLTDHLSYLAFHAWAERYSKDMFESEGAGRAAYDRLVWIQAWANKGLVTDAPKGRWIVYGIRELRRRREPFIRGPRRGPPTRLVKLDPRVRYGGLWRSLVAETPALSKIDWLPLKAKQRKQIRKWLNGESKGLGDLLTREWTCLRLNQVGRLKRLAVVMRAVRLPESGIGIGLRKVTLGEMLDEIARWKTVPIPDVLMSRELENAMGRGAVYERIRRALLARAVVFAANWAFFRWAGKQLGEPELFSESPRQSAFDSPELILERVGLLLRKNRGLENALRAVDRAAGSSGGRFSLMGAIGAGNRIEQSVVSWAIGARKGFVESDGALAEERKDWILSFTGSYAGSLRLQQAWRFSRDVLDALKG